MNLQFFDFRIPCISHFFCYHIPCFIFHIHIDGIGTGCSRICICPVSLLVITEYGCYSVLHTIETILQCSFSSFRIHSEFYGSSLCLRGFQAGSYRIDPEFICWWYVRSLIFCIYRVRIHGFTHYQNHSGNRIHGYLAVCNCIQYLNTGIFIVNTYFPFSSFNTGIGQINCFAGCRCIKNNNNTVRYFIWYTVFSINIE